MICMACFRKSVSWSYRDRYGMTFQTPECLVHRGFNDDKFWEAVAYKGSIAKTMGVDSK